MRAISFALLLASLAYLIHGIPIELRPEYEYKTRIVGGDEAPPGYAKHMAALVVGEVTTFLMCGGSIITNRHILTAAHCIDPLVIWGQLMESFHAVIGSNEWTSKEKNIGFTGFSNHPGWDMSTIKNDIGVLYLAQEIELSDNVAIIPLRVGWVDGGAKSFVTGWGRLENYMEVPNKLQLLHVNTLSPKQCADGVIKAYEVWVGAPAYDPKLEICTYHSPGHGMCNGDSGSALVLEETQEQIGIVSWGFPCAVGSPDVFVRISNYIDWLEKQIEK